MRVQVAVALLVAVMSVAAPASAGPDRLLSDTRHLAREHPEIWTGATIARGDQAMLVVAQGAPAGTVTLREIEKAQRAVAAVWGPVQVVVLVPASTVQAAVLAAPAAVEGMAALADIDHVIIEPTGFARLSPVGRQVVLTHELTHVATGAAGSADMAMWLVEGFADYVGYLHSGLTVPTIAAELAEEVESGNIPTELPDRTDFHAGSPRLPQAYEEAWLACRYIAEHYGQDRLVTLYRQARRLGTEAALRDILGRTTTELTQAWRAYLAQQLRP
ncbi:peptidase MA family metallohydrolase [Acrocarpospora catenulata]|uniref:peptidase MA family metallohydrolase n=1 Tax=Acrocarpospora catenulata TaxID=2836182 RepID=UPI001BDA80E2|nr:hypothetical protein [Acrocarpospora catenulata]